MSGRRSRDKGARVERGIVAALQAAGLAAVERNQRVDHEHVDPVRGNEVDLSYFQGR
jgi:hypothetical protein